MSNPNINNNSNNLTFSEMGYTCANNNLGKLTNNNSEYIYASYDNSKTINCEALSEYPSNNLNNILCTSPEQSLLCNSAFKNFITGENTSNIINNNDINYSIKNNIGDPRMLLNIGNKNKSQFNSMIPGYDPTNNQETLSIFNEILQETPLKAGCCLRSTNDTRPQITLINGVKNITSENITSENNPQFILNSTTIPANSCPALLHKQTPVCDAFYDVYCNNVIQYLKDNGYSQEQMLKFSPECACYASTSSKSVIPADIPSICYKQNCVNSENIYLDSSSRNKTCNHDTCNILFNASNYSSNEQENKIIRENCKQFLPGNKNNNKFSIPSSNNKLNSQESITQESILQETNSSSQLNNIMLFILIILIFSLFSYFIM